ncbi:DUF1674 domain-containing protein [Hyphomicrobium sp.]|jgi:hypothetical protein|uniref:DUF1674 domain-containing protein n=1 Tax=Hyphomicrobium sp. TaxID=82 RepID=UPI002CE5C022|nr:DUF1674 domain-containing protein [Hyphomicrobium sp.]HVZ05974.1 DUF1674 domain-containing protein [Hyphomicrobium sp.]
MNMDSDRHPEAETPETATKRTLTPEAQRALAEAATRRKNAATQSTQREIGGRDGPEPTRFGDWEKGGIASDF